LDEETMIWKAKELAHRSRRGNTVREASKSKRWKEEGCWKGSKKTPAVVSY